MASLRMMTSADVVGLLESRSVLKIGDYCEPLIDGNRTTVRVIKRYEAADDPPGWAWKYDCVDVHGFVHEVWRMDDPRRADSDQIAEFEDEERTHEHTR